MDAQIETVNVSVRRLRVVDRRNRTRVWEMLQPVFATRDSEQTDLWDFLTLCFTTDSITGVDFFIPDADALFDIWEQSWHKYEALDYELVQEWIKASNSVNVSPNTRKYLPPDQLTDEEKKNGRTSAVPTAVQ